MPRELLVLALSAGLSSADLAATVDKLRESSKSVGAHKRRQLFWDAYSQMSKAAASVADGAWVFLKYTADASQENPEGEVAPEDDSIAVCLHSLRQNFLEMVHVPVQVRGEAHLDAGGAARRRDSRGVRGSRRGSRVSRTTPHGGERGGVRRSLSPAGNTC